MDTPTEKMDKAIPKKKGLQKKHIGYIVFGIIILVLFYMAFFADRTSTYKDPILFYRRIRRNNRKLNNK